MSNMKLQVVQTREVLLIAFRKDSNYTKHVQQIYSLLLSLSNLSNLKLLYAKRHVHECLRHCQSWSSSQHQLNMAKRIENWYIDVDNLYDDRLGLAGMLFEACSSLLSQLVSGPAKTHLDALAYRSLRIQADRFSLWGDGVGAKSGTLDKALSDSKNLRRKLIYFLIGCGTCLANLTDRKL